MGTAAAKSMGKRKVENMPGCRRRRRSRTTVHESPDQRLALEVMQCFQISTEICALQYLAAVLEDAMCAFLLCEVGCDSAKEYCMSEINRRCSFFSLRAGEIAVFGSEQK